MSYSIYILEQHPHSLHCLSKTSVKMYSKWHKGSFRPPKACSCNCNHVICKNLSVKPGKTRIRSIPLLTKSKPLTKKIGFKIFFPKGSRGEPRKSDTNQKHVRLVSTHQSLTSFSRNNQQIWAKNIVRFLNLTPNTSFQIICLCIL